MELETRLTINDYVEAKSDDADMVDGKTDVIDSRTARQKANILSKVTFSWISAMFQTGYKRQIEIGDLDYLPHECYAGNTLKAFNRRWQSQSDTNNGDKDEEKKRNEILEEPLMTDADGPKALESVEGRHPKLLKVLLGIFCVFFL